MNRREYILKEATKHFAMKGFEGFRVNDFVKDININKSTFYYYFNTKKDLFNEILKRILIKINNEFIFTKDDLSKTINHFIDVMFNRSEEEVLLFIREVINGGEHLSSDVLTLMLNIRSYLDNVLKDTSINSFVIMHIVIGSSDFFISSIKFREKLSTLSNNKFISKDEIVNEIKSIINLYIRSKIESND